MSMAAMPWPWPPKDNVVLTRADLEDGVFTLSFDISGKLRCQIRNEQQTIEVASCYLMVLWPNIYTYVTVTWDWPDIEIFVEKQHLVGSNARSGLIPNQFLIVGGKPNPNLFDFSACNAKAMTRRHGRFAGSQPSDQTNLFQALSNEVKQLSDLLALIDGGATHHVAGIAARLRMLVADGDPLPLLQLCAASIGKPLMIYTGPHPRGGFPQDDLAPSQGWATLLASSATEYLRNPIDVDVWLDLEGLRVGGKTTTNRSALRHIGNTVGAHFDAQVHPTVQMLRSVWVANGGTQFDLLIQYLFVIARVMKDVSERLLVENKTV
jgi:hypothetical protein